MTIKELIKELKKYDEETSVCSGSISTNGGMLHTDLIIKESHPMGDRDTEEQLLLWIGFEDNQTYHMPTEEENESMSHLFNALCWK
jgi:hypothetical protein